MSAEFKSTTVMPEAEPESALTPIPVWLVLAMLLLLVWGAVYFDQHSGWFEPKVYAPYKSVAELAWYQPPPAKGPNFGNGQRVFELTCALCHNPDGKGKPGVAPPLAGSEWVNAEGANRLIRIPLVGLTGPIEVNGQQYNLSMTAMGASLSDKDLADVLSYIRQAWGNKAPPVSPEQVGAIRAELGNRTQAVTADELMKLPEE